MKEEEIEIPGDSTSSAAPTLLATARRVFFVPAHLRGLVWFIAAFVLCWCVITLLAWESWWLALLAYLLSMLCLGIGIQRLPDPVPFFPTPPSTPPSGASMCPGGVALCALATLATLWAAWHLAQRPYVDWSLLVYPLALVAAWHGEGWARNWGLRARLFRIYGAIRSRWRELLILIGITLAGLSMHLWLALQYPFLHGTVHDEAFVALQAWQMAHGTSPWPLYVTMGGAVALYQPLALIFAVTDPSMIVFRLAAIPMAVALVPAFYLLVRQMVAPAPALCAAALLSLAYWPTAMGALAFGWIAGSVFQCLGLALLLYGFRRWHCTACAASGMVLALCLYSYLSHRWMPIAALPVLFIFLARGPGSSARRLGLCLSFLVGFAVVAAPWIGLAISNPNLVGGDAVWVARGFANSLALHPFTALGDAFQNSLKLCEALVARPLPEGYAFDVLPSGGLFDHLTATLMLLGIGGAFLRVRHPLQLMLLFALITPVPVAAVVISHLSDVYRMNGIVPPLFLALALALNQGFGLALQARIRIWWALGGLLVLALSVDAYNVYRMQSFLASDATLCTKTDFLGGERAEGIALASETNRLRPQQEVYLVSSRLEWPWAWLFHGPLPAQIAPIGGEDPSRWPVWISPPVKSAGSMFWPARLAPGKTGITYFMTDAEASRFLPIAQGAYPGGQIRVIQPERCGYLFHLTEYTLTAQQVSHPPVVVRR